MPDPVVINSGASESSSSGLGLLFGAIAFGLVIFFLFYFAAPMLRNASTPSVPSINVPEQIDVNVNPNQ